jgi:hypothetical protein
MHFLKTTTGIVSLNGISDDNGVIVVVNSATSKNQVV